MTCACPWRGSTCDRSVSCVLIPVSCLFPDAKVLRPCLPGKGLRRRLACFIRKSPHFQVVFPYEIPDPLQLSHKPASVNKSNTLKSGIMNAKNYIQISGRLTSDARTNDTRSYARFTLAVNFTSGDRKEALFISCVAFPKEFQSNGQTIPFDMLTRGREVLVTGRISPRTITSQDGTRKTDMEIVANKIRDTDE